MKLSPDQMDALTEIVNIGVGRAAASLYDLIDQHIVLRVPRVQLWNHEQLAVSMGQDDKALDTSVIQEFNGAINGSALLAFPRDSGIALARLLSEQDEEQDELEIDLAGILEEVGNIVLNGVLGSLANMLNGELDYSVPRLKTDESAEGIISENSVAADEEERTILMADTHFEVADSEISGSLLLGFNMSEIKNLLDRLILETQN